MSITQKEYNSQYYLLHKEKIKSDCKKYYYTTRGTVPKLSKTESDLLNDLTVMCPSCKTVRIYSLASNATRARRVSSICNSCANTIKKTGVKLSDHHKNHISQSLKNRIFTPEWKRKLREARINELQSKFNVVPNYNPNACRYFDRLSSENGWNLTHALNGGEITRCGYFLDAYDPINNIVVEYDEKKHNGKLHKLRDEQRQLELISELKCQFYRYDEMNNTLLKVS
jgi:hypothetical protein